MKKTITRRQAIAMYQQLGQMALGHLNDADIETAMDNMTSLQTVAEHYYKLSEELHKRLFEGVDGARCEEYDRLIKDGSKDAMAVIDANYADIKALVMKKMAVMESLESKEVSIELKTMDRKTFTKAVLKAQPKTLQVAFNVLAPMFGDNAMAEADFAELDELLK